MTGSETEVAEQTDQRGQHRQRVLKGATIIAGPKTCEIACTIRNQHAYGAKLRVPADVTMPTHFTLYVPVDGIGYEAKVRWRNKDRVGVEFIGMMPKPRFHYG